MILRILIGFVFIAAAYFIAYEAQPVLNLVNLAKKELRKYSSQLDQRSQETLSKTCELFYSELKKNDLKTSFQKVSIQARDERIQNLAFLKELYGCFRIHKSGTLFIEIEAFTSDYEDQKNHDLQLQVSVYDFVSQNKLTEFGFVYNLPSANSNSSIESGPITFKE